MLRSFINTSFAVLSLLMIAACTDAENSKEIGQNAFTRAVKKPLSSIVTPVPNFHPTHCNSIVECRKYGSDLETIWQLNTGGDYSDKEYPDNCYILGKNGKYKFSQASCSNINY